MPARVGGLQGSGRIGIQRFDPEVHERLWAQVPPKYRTSVYELSDPDFARIFANTHTAWARWSTDALPEVMAQELAWWVWYCADTGKRRLNPGWTRTLIEGLEDLLASDPGGGVQSLTEVDPELWLKSVRAASYRRRGRLPAASSMTNARHDLEWMQQALQLRHSPLAWWEHDIWSPIDDARIPIKGYEPSCNHRINFSHTHNTWLQDALKYRFRLLLETGAGTWGTLLSARTHLGRYLDDYLAAATAATGVDHGPPLVANPADEIRTVALEFLSSLHSRVGETGAARGNRFSRKTIYHSQVALSTFYEFAFDNRRELAQVLHEPRWLQVTESHTRIFRPADTPNVHHRRTSVSSAPGRGAIADEDLSRMLEYLDTLGLPADQTREVVIDGQARTVAGINDPSAMRTWLLQALTGRRANEILRCAFHPLEPVQALSRPTSADAERDEPEFLARSFYRQTKIDGAPESILVGDDVVSVIENQQRWVRATLGLREDEPDPPFLFPALRRNLRGLRPRPSSGYHSALKDLTASLQLHDRHGNLLEFSRSHRLRHTKATTLLNLGAPIHVVMRYMGHRSPEMTLLYAATLAETAEREYLRARAIGRDGRELDLTGGDIADMLALTSRTDRVLPSGVCLLPPTKHCDRGNACYSCHYFTTDQRHLDDHRELLAETLHLIDSRKALHLERTGKPMSDDNVWPEQQLATVRSLQLIITRLESQHPTVGAACVATGAGVRGRPGYQPTGPMAVTIQPRRPGGQP